MKKILSLLLVFGMLFTIIGIFSSCNSNDKTTQNTTEPQKIALTKYNFYNYFSYEITGQPMYSDYFAGRYKGNLVITFYPIKNINVENCTITIVVDETLSTRDISILQYVDGEYEDKAKHTMRVPYDGKFTVTFDQNITYFSISKRASKDNVEVTIESVTGTIIEK